MAYSVRETESAGQDLDGILEYMAGKLGNVSAAAAFADELDDKYAKLADNPYMYEEAMDAGLKRRGYRRIPVKNYVILYLVDEARREVIIARIFYGKQDYIKLI
jgi:plasmid stabilization system protein ParE